MGSSIFFPICAIPFSILIIVLFLKKEHINSYETKIYKILIILNFIGLMLELLCTFGSLIYNQYPIISNFIYKSYLLYLLSWTALFTYYVYRISTNNKLINIILIKKILLILSVILLLLIYILPIKVVIKDNFQTRYTTGACATFSYLFSALLVLMIIIILLRNFKSVLNKKYVPVFVLLIVGTLSIIIQNLFPQLLLLTYVETLICVIMYFTIENPDLQMLREIHNAKEYNDNLNIEKSRFLFNMTKEVKVPLQNINRVSKDILMEDDIKIIKEDASKIKYSSNNLLDLVNKVLDINDLEKRKISTRQSKYNIELLFKKIISVVKPKIENKGIEFRINYDKSIPTNLYGDSIRIKQVVTTILNHSVDLTKEGFIELSVNSIIKHDNCRIVIKIEDSSSGMKQDEIEKVFEVNIEKDIENIDDKDISIGLVKKILDLIGGTIIVNSELGKGTSYTIVVDQQIPDSKKTSITEAVEKYEEMYIKNKRILLVIKDEDLNKKLTKYLSKYEVEIVSATGGQACLERIRKNEKYDLIIMEDELDKLSSIDTLNKLKQIENFKIPVIILTRKIEMNRKKDYSKLGFTDTYIIPVSKESVKEIITNYISKED